MPAEEWVKVADEAELEDGVPISVEVEGEDVLVVRVGEELHACGGKCTHYGGPLAEGLLSGHTITCPWHAARFDVRTGEMDAPPALDDEPHYPVKVEDGAVYVGKPSEPELPEMEGEDDRLFAIVGGGAAGNAAAETLRREGFAGRIVLITAEDDGPYDRPTLSKEFMSGEAKPEWLPLRSDEFYQNWGIELLTGRRVTGLDPDEKKLSFEDGEELQFDSALLATGAIPRTLDLPGAELQSCFALRSLADARAIGEALEETETAVMLGAGFIGMEVASGLRERDIEVHIVAPEDIPMERVFGPDVGSWIRARHEDKGVNFHTGTTAREISGDGEVTGVVLENGTEIECDMVLIAVGVDPAVHWLEGSGLVEDGVVPVDEHLMTRADGIYAAGDIAAIPYPQTEEPYRIEHWIVAERTGQHAARTMLGGTAAYAEVPFFWTMQCGTPVDFVGFGGKPDQTVLRGDLETGEFLAGYYRDGRLRAIAGAGRGREVLIVERLLWAEQNISPEDFADTNVSFEDMLG